MSFDWKSSLKVKYTNFVNSFNIDFGNILPVKIVRRRSLKKVIYPNLIASYYITFTTIQSKRD